MARALRPTTASAASPGTFDRSLEILRHAAARGLKLQVNYTVMAGNLHEMPALFHVIHGIPVDIWEVFFLIHEGRGRDLGEATPEQCEAVCHLLYRAGPLRDHGANRGSALLPPPRAPVRGGEGPLLPRPWAVDLIADLERRLGPSTHAPLARSAGTRDGRGIVFVSHDGSVSPSGFLPIEAGNVRERTLSDIYRHDALFRDLRAGSSLRGACGSCEYRDICGGSRARAHAHTGDPLASDPACVLTVDAWRQGSPAPGLKTPAPAGPAPRRT